MPATSSRLIPPFVDRLTGRVALLTGSSDGLGFAMAEALAEAGCHVALNGLEPPEGVEAKRHHLEQRTGTRVIYRQADVSTLDGVARLVADTQAALGPVAILVNNAVIRHFAPIVRFAPADWDKAIAVNLSAAFHAIRLTLPGMREQDYGRIFNMTSVYGSRAAADRVDYVTTKSALLGLTRAVALENLDRDVTCHALCPGSVLTPGTDGRVLDIMRQQGLDRAAAERLFLEGKQPSGRFVPSRSVTDLLLFLCGPVARDMTGAMLPVEGGWLAT
jgi:3-hydroxybutyrate dehydrogenase